MIVVIADSRFTGLLRKVGLAPDTSDWRADQNLRSISIFFEVLLDRPVALARATMR